MGKRKNEDGEVHTPRKGGKGSWVQFYVQEIAIRKESEKNLVVNNELRKEIASKWKALSEDAKLDFISKLRGTEKDSANGKEVGECSNSKGYLHSRCSPDRVYKLIQTLKPNQKEAVGKFGFGGLIDMKCTKLDHGLCLWLVNHFDTVSCSLNVHGSHLKIVPEDVGAIFGLKADGLEMDYEKIEGKKQVIPNRHCDQKGQIQISKLENDIKEDNDCGDDFRVRFVLFVLGTLLCPTRKVSVKSTFFEIVEDSNYMTQINWSQLVLSFLVRSIRDFKLQEGRSGISGCLYFLMLFYLDHVSTEKILPIRLNPSRPRVHAWGDREVYKMKRLLRMAGGFENPKADIYVFKDGKRLPIDENEEFDTEGKDGVHDETHYLRIEDGPSILEELDASFIGLKRCIQSDVDFAECRRDFLDFDLKYAKFKSLILPTFCNLDHVGT